MPSFTAEAVDELARRHTEAGRHAADRELIAVLRDRPGWAPSPGIGRDELGDVDGVLADDDVLRHVGAGETAIDDRVQDPVDRRARTADVEVRAADRLTRCGCSAPSRGFPPRTACGSRRSARRTAPRRGRAADWLRGTLIRWVPHAGDREHRAPAQPAATRTWTTSASRRHHNELVRVTVSPQCRVLAAALVVGVLVTGCGAARHVSHNGTLDVSVNEWRVTPGEVDAQPGTDADRRPQHGPVGAQPGALARRRAGRVDPADHARSDRRPGGDRPARQLPTVSSMVDDQATGVSGACTSAELCRVRTRSGHRGGRRTPGSSEDEKEPRRAWRTRLQSPAPAVRRSPMQHTTRTSSYGGNQRCRRWGSLSPGAREHQGISNEVPLGLIEAATNRLQRRLRREPANP